MTDDEKREVIDGAIAYVKARPGRHVVRLLEAYRDSLVEKAAEARPAEGHPWRKTFQLNPKGAT